jgi:hypothetical protein
MYTPHQSFWHRKILMEKIIYLNIFNHCGQTYVQSLYYRPLFSYVKNIYVLKSVLCTGEIIGNFLFLYLM